MNKFALSHIHIDYDEIQNEWRGLSKTEIKKAVYDFVYGYVPYLEALQEEQCEVNAYWHYGWNAPVIQIPPIKGYADVLYDMTVDLER